MGGALGARHKPGGVTMESEMGVLFPSNLSDPECVCRRVCQAMNKQGYHAACSQVAPQPKYTLGIIVPRSHLQNVHR